MKERKNPDDRAEFERRLCSVYQNAKNFETLVKSLQDTPPEFHRAVVDRVLTGGNSVFSDVRYFILARSEHKAGGGDDSAFFATRTPNMRVYRVMLNTMFERNENNGNGAWKPCRSC